MPKPFSTLFKTFDILHSALLILFFICVNHILYVTSPQGIFFSIIFFVIKIILFAGTLGTLVGMASHEDTSFTLPAFKENCKKYWRLYLGLLAGQLLLTSITLIGIQPLIPFKVDFFVYELLTLYAMAYFIIKDKYGKRINWTYRPIKIRFDHVIPIAVAVLGIFVVLHLSPLFHLNPKRWTNEPLAVYYYLHLFLFIFFINIVLENYPEIEKSFDYERELYLINPLSGGVYFGLVSTWFRMYPPIFTVLRALTPKSYHIKEFNRLPWKKRFFKANKLVAITSFTSNCPEAYKIAREFKRCGSTVVMGGPHVSYLPQEALKYCDAVVLGETENIWKDVIADYENNNLKQIYVGTALSNFDPKVHQELLESSPEIIKEFLETTRGCKFKCHFCTIPSLSNGSVRRRPIAEVVELVKRIKGKRHYINFIDNNIYNDPGYARELFTALKPLKMNWSTQCTIDIAKNDETLKLARESGAFLFLIGYETFGDSAEKSQGGKFSMNQRYLEYSKKIKRAGISIKAHFIFGFDTDRLKHMWDIYKFSFKLWPAFSVLSILTPLPGSQLYHQLQNENRISNYNWRYYDCHNLVFKHKHINDFALRNGFRFLKYMLLFTTGRLGAVIIIIYALDYIFFQWRHL